jgi:hypothetical protein
MFALFANATTWKLIISICYDVKQRFAIAAASSRTQEHRTRFQADHDTRIKSCATRSEPSIKRANSLRIWNFKRIRTAPLDQRITIATLQSVQYAKHGNSHKSGPKEMVLQGRKPDRCYHSVDATQPTDDFRHLCLSASRSATEFRFQCRQFNNEVSFASYGFTHT